jgi:hypothetical protein
MKYYLFALVICLMCSTVNAAGTAVKTTPVTTPVQTKNPLDDENLLEDWYLAISTSYAHIVYSGEMRTAIDSVRSIRGVSRIPMGGDLGVYWPLDNGVTVLGPSISITADTFSVGTNSLTVLNGLYGGSVVHYFGPRVGQGMFLRGDIGFASLGLQIQSMGSTSSSSSEFGAGGHAGGGYALPISEETRITFQASYSPRYIGNGVGMTHAALIGVGLLF